MSATEVHHFISILQFCISMFLNWQTNSFLERKCIFVKAAEKNSPRTTHKSLWTHQQPLLSGNPIDFGKNCSKRKMMVHGSTTNLVHTRITNTVLCQALVLNCQKWNDKYLRLLFEGVLKLSLPLSFSILIIELQVQVVKMLEDLWKASARLLQHQGLDQLQSGFHVP